MDQSGQEIEFKRVNEEDYIMFAHLITYYEIGGGRLLIWDDKFESHHGRNCDLTYNLKRLAEKINGV